MPKAIPASDVRPTTERPPDQARVLAIDLGTGGPKAAVFTGRGRLVSHAFRPVGLQLLPGGGAEQEPEEWWAAVASACREALGAGGVPPDDVVGVACTAQWAGTVAVDGGGRSLGPAISWLDTRGSRYVRRQIGGGVPVMGYDGVKLARWVRLTGGVPTLSGRDPVGHIHFLREERPDVYQATGVFLEPVDYLNLRLTGRACASWDSIGLHWVTDNRDIGAIGYDDGLLAKAGLERAKLPELIPTGAVVGGLSAEAAEKLGLVPGTAVVTGSGDLHSAAVGAGGAVDFEAHLYIGTSSWISCHVPFKKTDPLRNVASIPSALPGHYVVADEHETGGACLTFLRDNVLYPSDGLGGPAPDDFMARVNEVAGRVPLGANGVLFTPWLNGERSPVDDHTIRAGFHNLSLSTTRADLVRAVFEGVALNSRWLLGAVERFAGRRFDSLAFVGGGARSDLWAQMHADALDRTVRQVEDPVLANVRGAGLLALLALGLMGTADVRHAVPVGREYRPEPAAARRYAELGREFVHLYKRTKGIHQRLNG